MKGIEFVVDEAGKRKAVVIDLSEHGDPWDRFQAANPLPATLVRKLVKARIAENAAQQRHSADGASRRR